MAAAVACRLTYLDPTTVDISFQCRRCRTELRPGCSGIDVMAVRGDPVLRLSPPWPTRKNDVAVAESRRSPNVTPPGSASRFIAQYRYSRPLRFRRRYSGRPGCELGLPLPHCLIGEDERADQEPFREIHRAQLMAKLPRHHF